MSYGSCLDIPMGFHVMSRCIFFNVYDIIILQTTKIGWIISECGRHTSHIFEINLLYQVFDYEKILNVQRNRNEVLISFDRSD